MKRLYTMVIASAAFCAGAATQPTEFSKGIIMLNEDWFGHASSSMNFIANDGEIYYNVYKEANPARCLGNSSQFGQVFGDRIFVMSKQSYSGEERSGGRFIAMDANTLEFKGELASLPGGDGRTVCAVSAHKGYIGTSSGLYTIDLDTYTAGTEQLAPANANNRVQQTGEMLRYGKRLFVAQQNLGVVVVDIDTDEVEVVDLPKVATVFVTADGTLYAATTDVNAEFVRIDPLTLETETIDVEGSHAIGNPWSTWRKASIAADKEKNVVYFAGSGFSVRTVWSYDFDKRELNDAFFVLPGTDSGLAYNRILYGEGISVDPVTGSLIVVATESGFGTHSSNNWLYYVDPATGAVDKEVALEEYYWFPAMMIYPDYDSPEVSVPAIDMGMGGSVSIDLAEATALRAGNRHLVCYSAEVAEGVDVCEASIADGMLTVKALGTGDAKVALTAEYQGRAKTIEIPVTVSVLNGVEAVGEEAVSGRDVYTLTGVKVLRAATADQIRSLEHGVYVIGGKKVAIK